MVGLEKKGERGVLTIDAKFLHYKSTEADVPGAWAHEHVCLIVGHPVRGFMDAKFASTLDLSRGTRLAHARERDSDVAQKDSGARCRASP